ncbi:uncharacterized protein LOC124466285 [Hypomesus transpacificus]|uniref:uncharacterized protein LOC124466285 n=1 Tax=Hypomesus transpacificus TaxID=137520 RepID=UPI001F07726D|nr:uncharacterized protein LOC124466285 [Hypomesus transpacificus]
MECAVVADHDYCSVPETAGLDMAAVKNEELQKEIELLHRELKELKMQATFELQRFAGSDDDIRFYTRFASYRHFMMFWGLIEPSVHKKIRKSRARAAERRNEPVSVVRPAHTSLQPIDELFLFLMYLAAGLKERDLANRFTIHQSTVSRILSSWTNYLYTLLGSVCIWMEKEDVKAQKFKEFPDTQVIVDCTELKCQTPSSLLLQSGMYSAYKSHCTMKGLIGMAPHGAVTFVSSLYERSVSDKELFRRSGLADLLTDDMGVMVDKGFLISDVVKCKVYCPPFLQKRSQMLAECVLQTQKIARLRVHVERVIRRVKENKLFDSVIPLSIAGSINEMYTVACLLVNYQNKPLVRAWAK